MISVCMCTYGRPRLLEEAIEGFLRQTYTDSELVIINDRAEQDLVFNHPRVRIINLKTRFENTGDKRKFSATMAEGDWLCFWDDDDIYLPGHLQGCMDRTKHFIGNHISRDSVQWIDSGYKYYRIEKCKFVHTLLIRKDIYQQSGGHESLTRDEDTAFIRSLLRQKLLSHYKMDITKPTFIQRINTGHFRVSDYGNFVGAHKERWERVKEDADDRGEFGGAVLNPIWREDYIAKADASWPKVNPGAIP